MTAMARVQIPAELFRELSRVLAPGREPLAKSTVYRRIDQVRKIYSAITTLDATCVLAAENGIDLTKYVDGEMCSRVLQLRAQAPPRKGAAGRRLEGATPKPTKQAAAKATIIKLPGGARFEHAFLATGVPDEAKRMAQVYVVIYLFENSLRGFTEAVMQQAFGAEWW